MKTEQPHIRQLDLKSWSSQERSEFAYLVPSKYRLCLEGRDPFGISFSEIVAFGAFWEGEPFGIALCGCYEGVGLGDLFCLKIAEPHREVPLGLELLKKVEDAARQAGVSVIRHHFRRSELDSSFIEEVLNANLWAEPQLFMKRCFFDCYTFHPPWFDHPPRLPEAYTLFPWEQLESKEKDMIKNELHQGRFSESNSPFQEEESIDFPTSLGLRFENNVVGWCITHRIASDTLRYTVLYTDPEHQFRGYSIRLLVESIKLQQASPFRWSIFELNIKEVEPSWLKFVDRRLIPYSLSVDEIYETWKALSPDAFRI